MEELPQRRLELPENFRDLHTRVHACPHCDGGEYDQELVSFLLPPFCPRCGNPPVYPL